MMGRNLLCLQLQYTWSETGPPHENHEDIHENYYVWESRGNTLRNVLTGGISDDIVKKTGWPEVGKRWKI